MRRLGSGIVGGVLAAGSAGSPAAAQGYVVREFSRSAPTESVGTAVAGFEDVDGDGIPDFLVSSAGSYSPVGPYPSEVGFVRCCSGADGAALFTVTGTGQFGWSVAPLGDVDLDGTGDFAVGAPLLGESYVGRVAVFSGSSGAPIFSIDGTLQASYFGAAIAGPGDVDGDGMGDLLVGAPRAGLTNPPWSSEGQATLHSGAGGAILLTWTGAPNSHLGSAVAGAGDQDGDGVPDLFIVGRTSVLPTDPPGYAAVFSGTNGSAIVTLGPAALQDESPESVAALGDLDGDGVRELAVGLPFAPMGGIFGGVVRVFAGPTALNLFTWSASPIAAHFGKRVADAGDVDGDGVGDALVGAPGVVPSPPLGGGLSNNAGRAFVFSGSSGSPLFVRQGDHILDKLGSSVARVGDLDGDGKDDVLAGAPGSGGGRAHVFGGLGGATLLTVTGQARGFEFGKTVTRLGDLDGDGRSELAIADPTLDIRGEVEVVSGSTGELLFTLEGTSPFQAAGHGLANAGDVDADGTPDILVGAGSMGPLGANSGYAAVFSGSTRALLLTIPGGNEQAVGFSVAGLGDLDADGHADLLVGSPGYPGTSNNTAGRAQVFSGVDGSALLTVPGIQGPLGAERLGYAVDGTGDVDGDGILDFIVGAPLATAAGQLAAGRATLRSGADGSVLHTFEGFLVSQRFGSAVAGLPDLDGDGVPEVVVGAPSFQSSGPGTGYPGYAKVFSGASGALLHSFSATVNGARFGDSVASAGDVNGDGVADIAVGSPGWFLLFSEPDRGQAKVFSGLDGSLLLEAAGSAYHLLGESVAGAGDANGDGFDDLLVGAPERQANLIPTPPFWGYARVLSYAGIPDGASLFGSGCPGSGGFVPRILTGGGPPTVSGNPAFRILLSKSLGGTFAVLAWGISAPTWLGIPLPLDLGFLGLAGCSLHVPAFQFVYAATNGAGPGAGRGSVAFPIVANPAYAGINLDLQWYVVDPGPALVPGAMSEALRLVLVP